MCITNNERWLTCSIFLAGLLAFAGALWADEGGAASKPAASAPTPSSTGPGAGADPRVKPGESFYLEFPKLPKDRYDKLTRMQVCIPKNYDPHKQYPLYAWMGGGDGTSGSDDNLVNPDLYIRIGLPFPKGANNPHQSNMVGNYPKIWLYHKPMLDELLRVVPNISPSLRIIAGFSNGGHTLAGLMQLPRNEFLDYFNVYIPVEGGGIGSRWSSGAGVALDGRLKGRYICLLWGEKSTGKSHVKPMSETLDKFGMKVTAFAMTDTGHEFPELFQDKVRAWIKEKVVPGTIDEAMAVVEKAQSGAAVGKAYGLAKSLEVVAQGKDAERLGKQLARLEEAAGKQFAELKANVSETGGVPTASGGAVAKLKSFMKDFRGAASAEQCRDLLGKLGGPELDKLKAGFAKDMTADQRLKAAAKLKQFGKDWEGTVPADDGNRIFQDLSEQAFSALKAGMGDNADEAARKKAVPEIRKFMTAWEGTTGAAQAKTILDEIAAKAFEKIKPASKGKLTAPQRDAVVVSIVKFQAEWKDAQAANDAQTLLDDLGQQEFDEYKATWPSSMTRAQTQAIAGQLKKLQTKWQGTSTADLCDEEIRKLTNAK